MNVQEREITVHDDWRHVKAPVSCKVKRLLMMSEVFPFISVTRSEHRARPALPNDKYHIQAHYSTELLETLQGEMAKAVCVEGTVRGTYSRNISHIIR